MKIWKMAREVIGLVVTGALVSGLLLVLGGTAFGWEPPPPPPPPDASDSPGPARGWQGSARGPRGNSNPCGSPVDEVNTFTGNLSIWDVPVWYDSAGDALPFIVSFNSQSDRWSSLGHRWTHSYNMRVLDDGPYGATVIDEMGGETYYAGSNYEAPAGVFDSLGKTYDVSENWTGWALWKESEEQYYFDTNGFLTKRKDANGLTWTVTYSSGLPTKITDPLGRETTLTYYSLMLTRVTVPGGIYADFQYDGSGRLWKITDAAGDTYTFGYSGTATRVASITDPSGSQVWYTYGTWDDKVGVSAFGITSVTDSTVTFSFRPSGASYVDITDTKDGQSRVVRHIYDYSEGDQYGTLAVKIVDLGGLGTTEAWSYDSELRAVQYRDSYQTETGGKEHLHRFYYGDSGNPGRVTKYIDPENYDSGLGSNSPSYRFTYDSMGNVTEVQTPEDRETDIAYVSGTKRPSSITIKDADINGTPVDRTTAFTYWDSSKGYRLKTVTDARSNTTTLYYDSNGYLDYIDPPLGNNVDVTCNSVGDVTAVTDGNGNTTSYAYDGIHRLEQITYPDVGAGQKSKYFDWTCCGLDQVVDENGIITKFLYENYTNRLWKVIEDYGGLGYTTEYDYDEVGNVVSVKNARGKTRTFTYDDADRLVRADYPDSTYETWTLRDDGRVYQHRDGRGRVTTYRYDADDRLAGSGNYKAIDYPTVSETDVKIVRDDDGLVTSFEDGTGTTSMVYYPSGWVKLVQDAYAKYVWHEYNGVGDLSAITIPGNLTYSYEYNARNQLASVTNAYDQTITFSYDNGGRLTRMSRPGSYVQYTYNARNWLTEVLNARDDDIRLYKANYWYYSYQQGIWDHTGNPVKIRHDMAGRDAYLRHLTYDGVYRLVHEWCTDSSGTFDDSAYGYDAVGNRTSVTRDGTAYTYSYDDNDKLTSLTDGSSSATFGYDGAGNMASVVGSLLGTWSLAFDDESRLTSVTYPFGEGSATNTYLYDALGKRKHAVLAGAQRWYEYLGDRVLQERDGPSSVIARRTLTGGSYGDMLLHQGGISRWPLYDGIGTMRGLVQNTAVVTDTYDFDAFGRVLGQTGTSYNPHRYVGASGYITDPSGLVQLGARFYWPEVGRFVSQDPIGDGVNWYAYVGSNPARYIDPEGYGLRDTLKAPFVALGAWIGGKVERRIGRQNGLTPKDLGIVAPNGVAAAGGAAAIAGTAVAGAAVVSGSVCEAAGRSGSSSAAVARVGAIAGGAGLALGVAGGMLTHEQVAPQAESAVTAMNDTITHPSGTRDDLHRMVTEDNVYGDEDARNIYNERRY